MSPRTPPLDRLRRVTPTCEKKCAPCDRGEHERCSNPECECTFPRWGEHSRAGEELLASLQPGN